MKELTVTRLPRLPRLPLTGLLEALWRLISEHLNPQTTEITSNAPLALPASTCTLNATATDSSLVNRSSRACVWRSVCAAVGTGSTSIDSPSVIFVSWVDGERDGTTSSPTPGTRSAGLDTTGVSSDMSDCSSVAASTSPTVS